MNSAKRKLEPHPIDIFAGKRVQELRCRKGLTQERFAERIGVAYQQLQKYESAANRISASRLYLICEAFGTTIPKFFSELYSGRRKKGKTMKMLESAEAVKLAGLFFKMSPEKRQCFYETGHPLVKVSRKGWSNITDKPKSTSC